MQDNNAIYLNSVSNMHSNSGERETSNDHGSLVISLIDGVSDTRDFMKHYTLHRHILKYFNLMYNLKKRSHAKTRHHKLGLHNSTAGPSPTR